MAGKTPTYGALTLPNLADLLSIVDVSDPTQDPTGSTKKLALSDLFGMLGFEYHSGTGALGSTAGTISATSISNAISAGFTGIYLDPRYVWDLTGLSISGVSNFEIASHMGGSIGWIGGVLYNTGGYCNTNTTAHNDGIQLSGNTGAETQGITLRGLNLVGSNSNAVLHNGGRVRNLKLIDCFIYNTNAVSTAVTAGSNGTAVSTFAGAGTLSATNPTTAGFASTGNVYVVTTTGCALISYTGITTTTFTGCTTLAGTGTLATGGTVWQAAHGFIDDTAIHDFNSEDLQMHRCEIAGVNACAGFGINDITQHANDSSFYDLRTSVSAGPVAIAGIQGSNLNFRNYYDRSSPGATVATVWNNGSIMHFDKGEDQNNSTTGIAHLVSGGVTTLEGRTLTTGGTGAATATVTAGNLVARGRTRLTGTLTVSGTGNLDATDAAINLSGATIAGSGSGANVALNAAYAPGGVPTISFTGPVTYQDAVVATKSATGQTTTQSLTWTPPAANCSFRVRVMVHPTTAGNTVASITFTERGGSARAYNIPCLRQDGSSTAFQFLNAAADTYIGVVESMTDNSGTNIVVTVTPTGSTYRWSACIELLTTS